MTEKKEKDAKDWINSPPVYGMNPDTIKKIRNRFGLKSISEIMGVKVLPKADIKDNYMNLLIPGIDF